MIIKIKEDTVKSKGIFDYMISNYKDKKLVTVKHVASNLSQDDIWRFYLYCKSTDNEKVFSGIAGTLITQTRV